MVDYLNWHIRLLSGFSLVAVWPLWFDPENCERDKVVAVYTNPGWGVDSSFIGVYQRVGEAVRGQGASCWYALTQLLPECGALAYADRISWHEEGLLD